MINQCSNRVLSDGVNKYLLWMMFFNKLPDVKSNWHERLIVKFRNLTQVARQQSSYISYFSTASVMELKSVLKLGPEASAPSAV